MAECSSTLNTVLGGATDGEPLQACGEGGMWSQGQAKVPFSVRPFMDGRGMSKMISDKGGI